MALEVKGCYTAITADCGTITIDDITEYGNGELERTNVAIVAYLYKPSWNPDVATSQVQLDTYAPETVIQWTAPITVDGHYLFLQYVVEEWDYIPDTNYLTDDIVYESGSLWRALSDNFGNTPSTSPSIWELVTEQLDAIDTLPSTVTEGVTEFVVTCRSEKCYAKVVASVAMTGQCGSCTEEELGKLYRRVDVLLQGAFVASGQLRYNDADEIISTLSEICQDIENCGCQ
jgi:hypothetical protein